MKKAFKSSTIQDQQVVSKNSIPNPVADIYNQSDKPPPLSILTPYRYTSSLSRFPLAFPAEVKGCRNVLLCWVGPPWRAPLGWKNTLKAVTATAYSVKCWL